LRRYGDEKEPGLDTGDGRHCGSADFEIPGLFDFSISSKLRAGGVSETTKIAIAESGQDQDVGIHLCSRVGPLQWTTAFIKGGSESTNLDSDGKCCGQALMRSPRRNQPRRDSKDYWVFPNKTQRLAWTNVLEFPKSQLEAPSPTND